MASQKILWIRRLIHDIYRPKKISEFFQLSQFTQTEQKVVPNASLIQNLLCKIIRKIHAKFKLKLHFRFLFIK